MGDSAGVQAWPQGAPPLLAYGTMERSGDAGEKDAMHAAVKTAVKAGFRHIDCAELYTTTEGVGAALREIFDAGEVHREHIWITSKLKGMPSGDFSTVRARVATHLEHLQVRSVDLLLMHWPGPDDCDLAGDPGAIAAKCDFGGWFSSNVDSAWKNMQQLKEEGLCRHIGVSNFNEACLAKLPTPAPYANQIFVDALHPETELIAAMKAKGIHAMSYRPVRFVQFYPQLDEMGLAVGSVLDEKAKEAKLPLRQFIMAWLLQRGIAPIVQSRSEEHCTENLSAADHAPAIADAPLVTDADIGMIDMCGGGDEFAAAFKQLGA